MATRFAKRVGVLSSSCWVWRSVARSGVAAMEGENEA